MPVVELAVDSGRRRRSAVNWPSTQLNSVDFPEPFGPMMPRISPSRTSNDTSSTAVMPPKRFAQVGDLQEWRSWLALRRCGEAFRSRRSSGFDRPLDHSEHAIRAERHHRHDQRRIDDEVVAFRDAHPFRQQHGRSARRQRGPRNIRCRRRSPSAADRTTAPSPNELGSMNCTSGANSAPDRPPRLEPMAKAISV